jgi:hypothetical protein
MRAFLAQLFPNRSGISSAQEHGNRDLVQVDTDGGPDTQPPNWCVVIARTLFSAGCRGTMLVRHSR